MYEEVHRGQTRIKYDKESLSTAILIDPTSEILSQKVWQIVWTEGNAVKAVFDMQLIGKVLPAFGESL